MKKFFYSSSACIYPEHIQEDPNNPGLKESDAWPAQPQDAYGLEKLVSEELCKYYEKDFGIEFRIARFHNIYGPYVRIVGGVDFLGIFIREPGKEDERRLQLRFAGRLSALKKVELN